LFHIKKKLHFFIAAHWDPKYPLLLALSGGPDSRILLHLLLELQTEIPFQLGIAHVDHRWRANSQAEANELNTLAQNLGLPFHLKVLDPQTLTGNLEAACREKRLQFFQELCQKYHYQAVLLGHHADDQSETILKRIFEGSSLSKLGAIQPITSWNSISLWRPLLDVGKKELEQELIHRQISAFHDETNSNPRFLRARLRTNLLPTLANQFGKQMSSHLKNLGKESDELHLYLSKRVSHLITLQQTGPFGTYLNLQHHLPQEPIEQRHLIRLFCENVGFKISREGLYQAAAFLAQGSAGKAISCGKQLLYIDRHVLFAYNGTVLNDSSPVNLIHSHASYGQWIVETKRLTWDNSISFSSTNWHSVWKGEAQVILDDKPSYHLELPQPGALYPNSTHLKKWWNNAKVPAFIHHFIPVVVEEGKIIHEFLSGKNKSQFLPKQPIAHITLKWYSTVEGQK
jgi:tRNA(Ile)-lysidine synthase